MGLSIVQINPKLEGRTRSRKVFNYNFLDLENPISAQIRDSGKIKELFKKYSFIPYAATDEHTCYSLLPFLNSMKDLAPTVGACYNGIKTFALGKFDVEIASDPDFDFGEDPDQEPLTRQDKNLFKEYLKTEITVEGGYVKLGECMFEDLFNNGNYFIEVVLTETAGRRTGAIHFHPVDNCLYWATLKGKPRAVAVSPVFEHDYIRKHGLTTLPVNGNFVKVGNTFRTLLHCVNGKYNWYGRPMWVGSWFPAFRQYQDLTHLIKRASKQWMAEVFVEMEAGDSEFEDPFDEEGAREAGYQNSTHRAIDNYTANTDEYSPLWESTRPPGAGPAFIHEFNPNYNENFFKEQRLANRQDIIENMGWSERLLGSAVSEGIGSDAFMSDLKTTDHTILQAYREKILFGINWAKNIIVEWTGHNEFRERNLKYSTVVQKIAQGGDKKGLKELLDSVGVAVRAGVFTPTEEDEKRVRELFDLPGDENVTKAWLEDEGFRLPITLKGSDESEGQAALELETAKTEGAE